MKIRVKLKTKKKQALISYTERIFIKQLTEREKERESSKQKKNGPKPREKKSAVREFNPFLRRKAKERIVPLVLHEQRKRDN